MKSVFTPLGIVVALGLFASTGCKEQSAIEKPQSKIDKDHGHAHTADGGHAPHGGHGAGPHEGTVADWGGGKYHVEFNVDHSKQEGTVYILGSDEKTPVPIAAESIEITIIDPIMQLSLKASPQDGDKPGTSSRFVGNHEKLGVVQEYAGTISGVIDGTPYSGDFKEEPHGDHKH